MTTTSNFQNKPDYYLSKEECENSQREYYQSNPRYKNFNQSIFHAGDEEQFQTYRYQLNGSEYCTPEIDLENNKFSNLTFDLWEKNQNITSEAIINTFRYIFNKFKKGIFVKIVDNKLKVFLPFSKANFINEWSDKIKVRNGNILDFVKHISDLEKRNFNPKRVNSFTNTWFANNCLVRYEYPLSEGENNVTGIKNMLEELCDNRRIPDIEFFVNRRDFPLITRNGTEAYFHLWGSRNQPVVSHSYEKYIPILSMSGNENFGDFLIPTHEDWTRVQSFEGKWFSGSCRSYNEEFSIPWEDKVPTAVFRGATTGCGVNIDTNMRLKISKLSADQNLNSGNHLDAGITKWNLRPRKHVDSQFLQTIEINELPFGLVEKLTPYEQSIYKYIINIEGHVSAFRLSFELSMGSVILLVKSEWKIWFSDILKPYVHYVPVKGDLSDIFTQIDWCRAHDEECKQIAMNGKEFYNNYLLKDGIFDFMQKSLIELKKSMSIYFYNSISNLDLQISEEKSFITEYKYPENTKTVADITAIPRIGRSYGLLKGLEYLVNMINHQQGGSFETVAVKKGDVFTNKLGIIEKYELMNFLFAIKKTSDIQKSREHIHETYIGLKVINNLIKKLPNFSYVFGFYKQNETYNVVTEFIQGQTLYEYLRSSSFNLRDYFLIILQISLAIQVAQNEYCFVHYDLTPWNIVLQHTKNLVAFDYPISHDNILRMKTNIIPIIIDYGKSHAIVDGIHHGFINPYSFSKVQDILTLIITSVNEIMETQQVQREDVPLIYRFCDFISGTNYRREKFKNINELKIFLRQAKKYTELISSNKYELEEKSPLDLANHILSISDLASQCYKVDNYISQMDKGNARQIFEYIISRTDEERLQSFISVFSRLKHSTIPQPNNKFMVYLSAQLFETSLSSIKSVMDNFLTSKKIDGKYYNSVYQNTVNFLDSIYSVKISTMENKRLEYEINGVYNNLINPEYNEFNLDNPTKILEILEQNSSNNDRDLTDYKSIVQSVLLNTGRYKLTEADRIFYLENFRNLLSINSPTMKNNISNIKTLKNIVSSLYTKNINNILEKEVNNCSELENYLEKSKLILKLAK